MAGVAEAKLPAMVDRFYEAAAEPHLWRAALHEAGLAFGAQGAMLFSPEEARIGVHVSEGIGELVDTFLNGGWHARNPRPEAAIRKGLAQTGRAVADWMLFSPEENERLPFNADFVLKMGFGPNLGSLLARPDGGMVILTLERLARHGPFSQRDVDSFSKVLPHLTQAARLALQLGAARDAGAGDTLDLMSCGAVLLDHAGRVLRANARAERQAGQGFTLANGMAAASHGAANGTLQRQIAAALGAIRASDAMPGPFALPRETGRPLVAEIVPLRGAAQDLFRHAKAVLLLIETDGADGPDEAAVRAAFGLTPAEARLALALCRGDDVATFAEAHSISPATARAQLKAAFAKTGTHRQSELVALLARLGRVAGEAR